MDLNFIVPFILITLFIIAMDYILFIRECYAHWLVARSLEVQFYKWKNTNKSKVWFICWTIAILVNVVIFVTISIVYRNLFGLGFGFFVAGLYSLALMIAYVIIKNYVRYFHDKGEDD